ncbi:ABC transporter ATP-binding protein [Acidaminobacter sp. JC074]|uniref:ABC transporter ATP-binding protein n=1 Tax=Acidaminobacter sp. JC074 TaxID=2530199 RepID=UPI001F11155C|nr:ABC transporter ATP-binding protein [Acidaminobacter sp. JC074]MCH4888257.1 ABC transporter ATP-binding protein [Acidaminobacter sp. JC074]
MIEIKNLFFSYGKKTIFESLDLVIPESQFVSIIGPNGCGKSTLLKLLSNDLDYQRGQIHIEGKAQGDYSTGEFSRLLSFNRQDVNGIFPFTCLDYVLMGRRPYKTHFEDFTKDDLNLVEKFLKMTDTEDFIHASLNEVSGGELQRINLAKCLVQDTPYLLLDESFSAMDIYHTIKSLNMLKGLSDKNIICVMHDLNLVYQYSDHVILLKDGKVYAEGIPKEVLTEDAIKAVYGISMEYIENKGYIIRGE